MGAGIAEHLEKFWDPRMRKAICAYVDAGGAGLDPPRGEPSKRSETPSH